jgi:hypothetical protein
MASATIDLGLNATPFEQGLARAEGKAQSFTHKLSSLFARTQGGERRAEVALGGFASDLATGNVASAISQIGTRLSGLGLAAGVGVVAAIAFFQKLHADISATSKAASALGKELGKSLTVEAALGPEGISSQIEIAKKGLESLVEKRSSVFSKIGESAFTFLAHAGGEDQPNIKKEPNALAQEAIEQRIKGLTDARATSLLKVASIQEEAAHGSEREAALEKVKLEASEKRAKFLLARSDPTRVSTFKEFVAGQLEERAATEAINKKFNLKSREEELENRILNLQGKGLSKEREAIQILKERLSAKQEELSGRISDEQKTHIGTQIHGLENQLLGAQYAESKKSVSEKLSESIEAGKFQSFIRRSQGLGSSPGAYVRSPDAYNSTDPAYGDSWMQNGRPMMSLPKAAVGATPAGQAKQDASNKPLTKDDLETVMAKYWQ